MEGGLRSRETVKYASLVLVDVQKVKSHHPWCYFLIKANLSSSILLYISSIDKQMGMRLSE